jgi:hypothetical protein
VFWDVTGVLGDLVLVLQCWCCIVLLGGSRAKGWSCRKPDVGCGVCDSW